MTDPNSPLERLAASRMAERTRRDLETMLMSQRPGTHLLAMSVNGHLRGILPEVDALAGVPQAAAHHPEIDTLVHVALCLDAAAIMDADLRVRWAVLLHDVGKALTPTEILPKHHGHERAGLVPAASVCDRFDLDAFTRSLVLAVCGDHTKCHGLIGMSPKGVLNMLLRIREAGTNLRSTPWGSTLGYDQLIDRFAAACTADHRGRLGSERHGYPQADMLRRAWDAVRNGIPPELDIEALTERLDADGGRERKRLQDLIGTALAKFKSGTETS